MISQRGDPRVVSVRALSNSEAQQEGEAISLVFGLVAVLGLLIISVIAISGPAWLSVIFGAAEVVVAWRVSPPAGARSLRPIAGLRGL